MVLKRCIHQKPVHSIHSLMLPSHTQIPNQNCDRHIPSILVVYFKSIALLTKKPVHSVYTITFPCSMPKCKIKLRTWEPKCKIKLRTYEPNAKSNYEHRKTKASNISILHFHGRVSRGNGISCGQRVCWCAVVARTLLQPPSLCT